MRRTIALLLCGGMLGALSLVTGHAASLEVTGGVAQTFTVDIESSVPTEHEAGSTSESAIE